MAATNAVRVVLLIYPKSTVSSRKDANLLRSAPSLEADREAAMYARMALEILGDGPLAYVLDTQVRERRRVELEPRVVGREHQAPGRAQQLQRPANHADLIALHVQHAGHAFGIGESRRVQENQIEARTLGVLLFKPLQTVRAI